MARKSKNILLEQCLEAVRKTVAIFYEIEATTIIQLTTNELRKEFMEYYKKGEGNICCLVLDKAKRKLVAEGIMEQKDGDAFGKPLI